MTERLKFMGRRQESELKKKSLEIKIQGLVQNLREALDPFEKTEKLQVDKIAAWSVELADAHDQYMETVSNLERIQNILGR
jgi:hypothetical protein